jgi:cytoskeletal protein RodZ
MGLFWEGVPELAAIRKRTGISLKEIARSTRISIFYLEAIENGEINKLPGGIYTRSYIRQYARAIEYCENDLLRQFGIADEEVRVAQNRTMISRPRRLAGFLNSLAHVRIVTTGAKRSG